MSGEYEPAAHERKTATHGLILFLVYAAVQAITARILPESLSVTPALSVAIAALYFGGLRLWYVLALTALATEAIVHGISVHGAFVAIAATLSGCVGAILLKSWQIDPIFRRKSDVYILLATTAITALIAPAARILMEHPTIDALLLSYIGALVTSIIFVSFLLRFLIKPGFRRTARESLELVSVFALLMVCGYFVSRGHELTVHGITVAYFIFVPLMWIALRLRPRFVTLALVYVYGCIMTGLIQSGYAGNAVIVLHEEAQLLLLAVTFLFITAQEEDRRASHNTTMSHMQTLQNAVVRIQQESKAKADFIAVLAHELRNPLAPIVSTIEYLKLVGGRNAEDEEALNVIDDRAKTMRRILEDLLDVSRIESGTPVFDLETMDLRTALHASILTTEHYRSERHQHLMTDISSRPLWVSGDQVRIEQIFTNLLSNASKYSHSGDSISLRAHEVSRCAEIQIRDNGIGIASESLQRIFLPFEQVHDPSHKATGLGIGLTLVKNFAEMLGGGISVESEGLGRGSTFTIRIPLTNPPHETTRPATVEQVSKNQLAASPLVLIVDDNDAAASSLGRLLEAMQYRVLYSHDGENALQSARRENPSLILMDLNLPGISGAEVARTLRASGFSNPIAALSGYGEKNAEQMYGDISVFDAFLVKPVGMTELKAFLPRS